MLLVTHQIALLCTHIPVPVEAYLLFLPLSNI
jgi:hypothetical protein